MQQTPVGATGGVALVRILKGGDQALDSERPSVPWPSLA